jgi:hypothetical protein
VRTRALRIAACAVGAALLVAGAASGRTNGAGADRVRIDTTMTAAEEVPATRGDVANARGTFSATVTSTGTGGLIEWQMTFSGLTGRAVAAHIHLPARRGEATGVVVPLCAPCESPVSGSANVSAAVLAALNNGTAYVNVHTPTNLPGEIRGQLAIVASVRTSLTARQEVPRPRRGRVGRARATFTGTVRKEGGEAQLAWRLTFRRLTGRATAAHVHIGPRGRSGRIAIPLCAPCRSGANGREDVPALALTALQTGRAYVHVHTRRNRAGEVRGQIGGLRLTISTS